MKKPTITLCMIVRNEIDVIERCLESVKPYITSWVICDTGSTDGSIKKIEEVMSGIPGMVHSRPWVNFGHNRSELMKIARGSADYLLTLDADWTFHLEGKLPKLTADAYMIRFAGDLDFALPTLIRGDKPWRYEGAAHEYLTTDGEITREVLENASFVNHSDGADSSRRIERNRRLLEQDLKTDPENPRTIFYLGQTYRDLGKTAKAIRFLRKRLELGGWDEEIFYCQYQIGKLLLPTHPDEGIRTLLGAWQYRPSRIEPLVCLATYHRERDEHYLAELYATRAYGTPYSKDVLFVERDAWSWRTAFELSISSWYTGNQKLSLALSHKLLESGNLPPHIEPFVRQNSQFKIQGE